VKQFANKEFLPSFINHYIFPGGYLPSITQLLNHISQASRGTLIVEKVENIGGHYAKTLRLWRENFLREFDSKIAPSLRKQHPGMNAEEMAVFRRKWEVSRGKNKRGRIGFNDRVDGIGTDGITIVLFHVLRGGLFDQDSGGRNHHCRERRCLGTDGRNSYLDGEMLKLAPNYQ